LAALLYQPTTQPDTALSLGGYTYVDASGQALGERRPWLESGLAVTDWLYNCLSMPGAALVRRDWFERLGGFDPACEIAEDWDFFLRLAYADGPMAWVRRSVCAYRLHPGNSTAGSARHRAGSVATLDKFFTQPNLPPELAAHAGPARAWLHVLFGQRACHNGEAALARAELEAARRADPSLATTRHAELLDLLLTRPADRLASSGANSVRACLPADWPVSAGELRAAEGRVAMAGFYAAWRRADWAEANRQLGRAVRRNPAWLFQRSVWVYSWQAMRGRHARR
jgi:hypothetical protein